MAPNVSIIQSIVVFALPLLFAITLHEAAHAYVARRCGDNLAYSLGRVTLNPLRHIDPLGTVALPLLLLWASGGAFSFGYAKPVPVRFGHLRRPQRDMVWVALAGPAANLLQALLWGALGLLLQAAGVSADSFAALVCATGVAVNVLLCALNLFPLPPLDGGRIVTGLLPPHWAQQYVRVEPYGFFIVMALAFSPLMYNFWIQPLSAVLVDALKIVLLPLQLLLP